MDSCLSRTFQIYQDYKSVESQIDSTRLVLEYLKSILQIDIGCAKYTTWQIYAEGTIGYVKSNVAKFAT